MSRHHPRRSTRTRLLAGAALLAAGNPALAEDDSVVQLIKPESTVRLGVGWLSEDDRRFGQYSGAKDKGAYLLLDADYVKRDDATGAWTRLFGRNVGLDSRELRGEYQLQGNFGASVEYSGIPRNEPVTVNTGLTGIGSASQTLNGTPLRDVQLDTKRNRWTLGFDKELPAGMDFKVRYIAEDKSGARLFGRGTADFLTEPIDFRSQQLEATLGYTTEKFQLVGGYYGSAFTNHNSVIDVTTGTDISLAPDNESHQLFVSGGYSFSPTTRGNFKVAYTRGTQNENFFTAPTFPGNTQTSLNGRVDTTLVQAGITARPTRELSLLGNLRYEDRDDKTPRVQFLDPSAGRDGFNTPFSRTTPTATGEASYLLPIDLRLTGGLDYEKRKRSVLSVRQASWREENDETTLRLEARRSLSQTLNGALTLSFADRDGSDFLPANNNANPDLVDPIHFADRKRNKVRLSLDWVPMEALSLQLVADYAHDSYSLRELGPESGRAQFLGLDANYALSDVWQLVGWMSFDDSKMNQTTQTAANGAVIPLQNWEAQLRNKGEAFGLGVRGRINEKINLGADLQYANDSNVYNLNAVIPASALLPEINTRRTTLRLFGEYTLQKNLSLRLDLIHDQFKTNDWTWSGFVYTDGTTAINPNTSSTLVGFSVVYRMW